MIERLLRRPLRSVRFRLELLATIGVAMLALGQIMAGATSVVLSAN